MPIMWLYERRRRSKQRQKKAEAKQHRSRRRLRLADTSQIGVAAKDGRAKRDESKSRKREKR